MAYAFFDGKFVPLGEAKVSIMTHSFNYGTGCFEGIRAYWNAEQEQLYAFHLKAHFERLVRSCKILHMSSPYTAEEMVEQALELLRRNECRTDTYIRPIVYKSSEIVGVRLHGIADSFCMFTTPFGKYLDPEKGSRCCVSSWRRIDDNSIPARAKVVGGYINSALAKTEAHEAGCDEAIMLTQDGHVSEGSGENIFLVEGGKLVTPPSSDNILMGITRAAVMTLARNELGVPTVERSIDRSELYAADEVFMTGTAAEVTPVIEIDHRPVGSGGIGQVTARLQKTYMNIATGVDKRYAEWRTPVLQVGVKG
ncbi:MAG: branched-chain amino acid transaminase [Chloroflexi bacterium]|nr:branched-chain amino acid transaminase [Chloroflexota bacterium]